jgi:hypothetical protein
MEKIRRYDIDWIRVIVFDILIFYHVCMFFVPWGWHIKNDVIVDWLVYPMVFVNQWRLPILFVVSGMGTRFALAHRSGKAYIKERFIRLYIPLAVGMLIVVPPQVYLERITDGDFIGSFLSYYPQTFSGIYPEGNFSWHHLWFLPYLLVMSIMCTPLFLWLRKEENPWIERLRKLIDQNSFWLYAILIPLFIVEAFLEPIFPLTRALIDDWYGFTLYLVFFLAGFMLVSVGEPFWRAVVRLRFINLLFGCIFLPALIWAWRTYDSSALIPLFKIINMWSWILAIFGFASKYLNQPGSILKYRNQAVYPFYILHQTVTILLGYWLMNQTMHYGFKMLIMVVGTFGISWLLYEFIIKRFTFLRPLFGLKLAHG